MHPMKVGLAALMLVAHLLASAGCTDGDSGGAWTSPRDEGDHGPVSVDSRAGPSDWLGGEDAVACTDPVPLPDDENADAPADASVGSDVRGLPDAGPPAPDGGGEPDGTTPVEDVIAPSDEGPPAGDAPAVADSGSPVEDGGGSPPVEVDASVPPAATVKLLSETKCVNPCTFSAVVTGPVAAVRYDADGWVLGTAKAPPFPVTYKFTGLGERVITASGLSAADEILATDTKTVLVQAPPEKECPAYVSKEEEYSPVQIAAAGLPTGIGALSWAKPAKLTWKVPFAGKPGKPASHEGLDFVHDDPAVPYVAVRAAADGEVVYVRLGCPQSAVFSKNTLLRECGAGWGNHVVLSHGAGIYTRYAHLKPDAVEVVVGDVLAVGNLVGEMGNSGRSDVRHLHFELGSDTTGPDSCAASQSFEAVYDPALLGAGFAP